MLGAQRYPFDVVPYSSTAKTEALRYAAPNSASIGNFPPWRSVSPTRGRPPAPGEPLIEDTSEPARTASSHLPPLRRMRRRLQRRRQEHPRLQLSVAGCRCRRRDPHAVRGPTRSTAPPAGGYRVTYVRHEPDDAPGAVGRAHTVTGTRRLVLGAGTFGSTYLLLRNRAAFPSLSPTLGTRFSGNGDLLTFLSTAEVEVEGTQVPRPLNPEFGPVITSAIRLPDTWTATAASAEASTSRTAATRSSSTGSPQSAGAPLVGAGWPAFWPARLGPRHRGNARSNVSGDIAGLLGGGTASATMLPVLAMGRDIPGRHHEPARRRPGPRLDDGQLGRPTSTGSRRPCGGVAGRPRRVGRQHAAVAVQTGHHRASSGGCRWAPTPADGVVDAWGEAFGYPGLHVVDGSVMPGPVGPNPSLTIAAFAERAAAHIIQGAGS